jgi:hypothetical protein
LKRRAVVEKVVWLEGTLESFYLGSGKTTIVIVDLPDNVSAVPVSIAVSASGAGAIVTTLLLTVEDIDRACKKSVA